MVGQREGLNLAMVVTFGIAIPLVVLVSLFVVANFVVLPKTDAPAAAQHPDDRAGGRQAVVLGGALPGQRSGHGERDPHPRAHARERGRHDRRRHPLVLGARAQPQDRHDPGARATACCSTPTGPAATAASARSTAALQHAHMSLYVFAEPPARFRAWLAAQARPRRAPATPLERRGEQVFMHSQCASCHTIRGTPARGTVGPDLTHVGGRTTLAALTIPNTPRELTAWLTQPAARQAGQPHADAAAHAGRPAGPGRLPGVAEVMAVIGTPAGRARAERLERIWKERPGLLGWLTTTDHKRIGILYLFASLAFFGAGGVEALLDPHPAHHARQHPAGPAGLRRAVHDARGDDDLPLRHPDLHRGVRQLPAAAHDRRARHGVPAHERAVVLDLRRVGDLHVHELVIGSAPDAGWFNYVPLASQGLQPRAEHRLLLPGADLQRHLHDRGGGRTSSSRIFKLRAPGMSLNRMPLFCFAFLAVSFALIFALPPLTVAARLPRARPPASAPTSTTSAARRRPADVAAPVLDLRPPRGLHHHPARVRDRDVDHPDVRAPPDGRVPARRAWPRSSSPSSASASGRTTCSPSGCRPRRRSTSRRRA